MTHIRIEAIDGEGNLQVENRCLKKKESLIISSIPGSLYILSVVISEGD